MALFAVLLQFALMAYAGSVVRYKMLTDRRVLPNDKWRGFVAGVYTATFLLTMAVVLEFFSGERRFASVREIWGIGFFASAVAVGIAIRILKGDKRDV